MKRAAWECEHTRFYTVNWQLCVFNFLRDAEMKWTKEEEGHGGGK